MTSVVKIELFWAIFNKNMEILTLNVTKVENQHRKGLLSFDCKMDSESM